MKPGVYTAGQVGISMSLWAYVLAGLRNDSEGRWKDVVEEHGLDALRHVCITLGPYVESVLKILPPHVRDENEIERSILPAIADTVSWFGTWSARNMPATLPPTMARDRVIGALARA